MNFLEANVTLSIISQKSDPTFISSNPLHTSRIDYVLGANISHEITMFDESMVVTNHIPLAFELKMEIPDEHHIPQKAFKKIIEQFKVESTLTTSFPALQDSVSAAASKRARYSGKECFYSEEAKLLSKDINKLKTRLLAEPSRDSTRAS